ncbi:MAG: tRNA pseudouridine(55) synthase TruB [Fibrobacteria bacterium]|nr:tRNA pseudouridine(55) synthase TruB [Fibrobacteria bacterium]
MNTKVSKGKMSGAIDLVSGFLLLDKPAGISSFKSIGPVKHLFRGRKVGFAGTLDPDASGLLLLGIGEATKLLRFVEDMPKIYQFTVKPGIVTDSYDAAGTVISEKKDCIVAQDKVVEALKCFIGEIQQVPPVYSALKIQGKRACDRARAGEKLIMKARKTTVYSLELLEWLPDAWKLEVKCSRGTYVRSLAHDLGQNLGCGAIATEIRRTAIGSFDLENAVNDINQDVKDKLLLPDVAVAYLPMVHVPPEEYSVVSNGGQTKNYLTDDSLSEGDSVRIYNTPGNFLGIGEIKADGFLQPKKMLQISGECQLV